MKNEPELRTLCKYCADDYRQAGYSLTLNGYEQTKQPCDKCDRPGYEYIMKEPKKHVK